MSYRVQIDEIREDGPLVEWKAKETMADGSETKGYVQHPTAMKTKNIALFDAIFDHLDVKEVLKVILEHGTMGIRYHEDEK